MAAPLDTSADAHEAQTEAYRLMGGAGRLAAMFRLIELDREYVERWAAALGVLDLWRQISTDQGLGH